MGRYSENSNPKGYHGRAIQRSRASGCWNCGLPYHKSKDCTAPTTPRCMNCRKRGFLAHRCPCSRRKSVAKGLESTEVTPTSSNDCEPCVLISIHHKQVKAVINTDAQETRIGKNVVSLIERFEKVNPKKKVIKSKYGMELVYTLVVRAGVHLRRKYPIEVIIDQKISANEMNIGLRALQILGHRITVAGEEAMYRPIRVSQGREQRRVRLNRARVRRHTRECSMSDDDKMSFLDEQEAERIRQGIVKLHQD